MSSLQLRACDLYREDWMAPRRHRLAALQTGGPTPPTHRMSTFQTDRRKYPEHRCPVGRSM
eukprot:3169104-Lingulodinium_polyedra.AAC.1